MPYNNILKATREFYKGRTYKETTKLKSLSINLSLDFS